MALRGKAIFEIQYDSENISNYLQNTMRYLLEKFKSTESIFNIKKRYGRNLAKLSTATVQMSVVLLRLQYLNLFVLHFPVGYMMHRSYRNLALCTEFKREVKILRNQVDRKETTSYFLTVKHLIHLAETMTKGLLEQQMLWYNCWRCGFARCRTRTNTNPIADCLAQWHNVPTNVVTKIVGFPTKCTCRSFIYHCMPAEEDYSN